MSVWYEDGIRFECHGCGACCTDRGDYAYVFLNRGEEKALARHLGLSVPAFLKRHTQTVDGYVTLKSRKKRCVFLDEENRCAVYEARPLQCRTWPFWPENLLYRLWTSEIAPHCPGIGTGRIYTRAEIEETAFRHRTAELLEAEREEKGT